MIVIIGTLTSAQSDAIAAALTAGWAIPEITNQPVLDGDSITQGVVAVTSDKSLVMLLSEPGSAIAMPGSYRVVNLGVSGDQTSNLATRRDQTNTMYDNIIPGGINRLALQVGRNDLGVGAKTGAQTCASIVGLLNTTTTGYLQRGWTVKRAINIAASNTIMTEVNNLRALLRSPSFLTDCLAGAGQTYDGKLSIMDVPLWAVVGQTLFSTAADATNTIWYQGDVTYPTIAGTAEMAKAYAAGI